MAKAVINLQKESGGIVKISPVDGTGVTEVTVPESGNLVSVGTAVTDNAIARFDGNTGKLQNSGVVIDDSGNISAGQTVSVLSTSYSGIQTTSGNTSFGYINFGDIDDANIGQIAYNHSTDSFNFITNNSIKANITSSGDLLLISGTGALGYGTGAGGTVTQLTSKSTAVTLNKPSGVIFTSSAALAAGASAIFTFNNNSIRQYDNLITSGNDAPYRVEASATGNGYCSIRITNLTGSSLSQVVEIAFQVIRGATA